MNEDISFFKEHGKICIVGDFNCRIGELESRISREEREREGENEIIFKRRSEDKKNDFGGKNLINFMNDHNLIILNGLKSIAPMTSIQWRGQTVIDYIISDQELYQKVKNFRTWKGEFSLIGDHRLLS